MKENLIQQLIEEQEQVIIDIEAALDQRHEAADIDEEDTRDDDDFAQQELNKDFARKFVEQLEIAQVELSELKKYKYSKNDSITKGALVETDKLYIVVGPSVQNSQFNNKKVVCMSDQAPAYKENEGKTGKDKLKLGTNQVKIISIQ